MLSVVVSYLRVCLKGRGLGPTRPPEPDLGLSRWRLKGLNLVTAKAKHPDSQGPANGGAESCPVLPMAGQASPHPRGSKDTAHKVRLQTRPATIPPASSRLSTGVGLPTQPVLPCHQVYLKGGMILCGIHGPWPSPCLVFGPVGLQ